MFGIKKLDSFVLKAFLPLFCGTFFISLFVLMLQFMWRYVDELVGKGLSAAVLGEFFYYAALTLVPMALPLAVLLASLITFGNLAEKFELLAMKAAGVQLTRVLLPVALFATLLAVGSFYFQNEASPNATRKLATLIWGMKQKNPELDIPEGMFYNEIPGLNLYVERKNQETGHLYNVTLNWKQQGQDEGQIVLADSARIRSTADHRHLELTLWNGKRYKDFRNGAMSGSQRIQDPYLREAFDTEVDLLAFDANFNALDGSLFSGNAQVKNLNELSVAIDSIRHTLDSVGHSILEMPMVRESMRRTPREQHVDTMALEAMAAGAAQFDTLRATVPAEREAAVIRSAQRRVSNMLGEYDYRRMSSEETAKQLRRHEMERHRKFSMSLCCIIFFFIGAPLGAITKKGGLGLPVVISVLIFIIYYVVNVAGEKLAKTGDWEVWKGIWMSTAVFAPIAMWLTYKANRDSAIFNKDAYIQLIKRLRVVADKVRHLFSKRHNIRTT